MKKPKRRLHRSKLYAAQRRLRRTSEIWKWNRTRKQLGKKVIKEVLLADPGEIRRLYGVSLDTWPDSEQIRKTIGKAGVKNG